MAKAATQGLTPGELLEQAFVPENEQPYEVPANWVWTRMDRVAEIVTGGTPSKSHKEYYGGNFPFIKPADLDQARHVVFAAEYLSEMGKNVSRVVRAGATSVCCIGTIGKCGYLEMEAATNQQINSVIPKINDLFVYYYCCSNTFVNQLSNAASATTISIVNKSKMSAIPFPLAPLAEQQRIVDRIVSLFAKLEQAKELVQDALDSFETRKASIFQRAFTGELTAKWREQQGVGMASWEKVTLGKLLDPMTSKKPDESQKYFRYIDIDAIDNDTQTVREPKSMLVSEAPSRASRGIETGNVIFSVVRPYLKNIAFIDETLSDCIASTGFYVCKCKPKLGSRFLYQLLRSPDTLYYYTSYMKGDNSPSIRKDDFEGLIVDLPSLPEQQEIVRVLDNLFQQEQKAKELANVIEKIHLMKKAVLARAFRGGLGTNDPAEESAMELLKEVLANR